MKHLVLKSNILKFGSVLCVFLEQEVIQLTQDLAGTKPGNSDKDGDEPGISQDESNKQIPVRDWKPGDKCMAMYSEDKWYGMVT